MTVKDIIKLKYPEKTGRNFLAIDYTDCMQKKKKERKSQSYVFVAFSSRRAIS